MKQCRYCYKSATQNLVIVRSNLDVALGFAALTYIPCCDKHAQERAVGDPKSPHYTLRTSTLDAVQS